MITEIERRKIERLKAKDIERTKEKEQLIMAEMKATTQAEKDIIHLKQIELSITPYSSWWRWGYLSSVRRARQALEREVKQDDASGIDH